MKIFGKNVISGNKITIDGVDFVGRDLIISDDGVFIDGKKQSILLGQTVNVVIHGDVEKLENTSGDIKCNNVGNISTTSGDVDCNSVNGNVKTVSGDVNCKSILGNVKTVSGDIG